MLVFSRKLGEEIVIGNDIRIAVVAIHGEKVSIGVSAPKEVVVDRQEIHERRQNSFCEEPAFPPNPAIVIGTIPE